MTKLTKAQYLDHIDTRFPDNTANEITPERVRADGADLADSYLNSAGVTTGQIPMMSSEDGVAAPSSLTETTESVEAGKDVMSGASRVGLQAAMLSSPGETVLFQSLATNRQFVPAGREILEDGSGLPVITKFAPVVTTPFQSRSDIEISGIDVGFTILELISAHILRWTITTAGTGKFYFIAHRGTSASDPVVFTSHRASEIASGDVFDLTDVSRTFNTIFAMEEGVTYFIRLVSPDATPFTLRGTLTTQADVDDPTSLFTVVGEEVPEFSTTFLEQTIDRILVESDIPRILGDDAPVIDLASISGLTDLTPDAGVDLGGARTITFSVSDSDNINGDLSFSWDGVDLATDIGPATTTASVTIPSTTTAEGATHTARLYGDTATGATVQDTIRYRTLPHPEFAYFGAQASADFSTVDVSTLSNADVTNAGARFGVAIAVPDTHYLGILVPANRDATAIIEQTFNADAINEFTKTTNVRTIDSQQYNLYTHQNSSGFDGNVSYEVRT